MYQFQSLSMILAVHLLTDYHSCEDHGFSWKTCAKIVYEYFEGLEK